jgi:hypothetical protein
MANEARFEVYERGIRGDMVDEETGNVIAPQFGWRFRAVNGQITAIGGEGFTRREDAHRAVRQFLVALADTGVDLSEAVPRRPSST